MPPSTIWAWPTRRCSRRRPRPIPRFSIWCGTRATERWAERFWARVVVSGHLHVPRTVRMEGVRFEEVSFGYPRERKPGRTIEDHVRQILPDPHPELD